MHLQVDTELVYAYAITKENGPLEEFISGSHQANLQSVGDRCYEEGLFEAARIIFQHIPNWGKLASTLVKMHLFQPAVDAARKANSPRTWKEVLPVPHDCPFPSRHLLVYRIHHLNAITLYYACFRIAQTPAE